MNRFGLFLAGLCALILAGCAVRSVQADPYSDSADAAVLRAGMHIDASSGGGGCLVQLLRVDGIAAGTSSEPVIMTRLAPGPHRLLIRVSDTLAEFDETVDTVVMSGRSYLITAHRHHAMVEVVLWDETEQSSVQRLTGWNFFDRGSPWRR